MPTITGIKQQKNKGRVNVYLDDVFGFGIDLDNFVLLGLKVGQELTDERISEIVKKAEYQKILDKLLRFATLRPRSKKEVDDYFRRKKVHESLYEELFKKLVHLELVDDQKFAKWWVEQRQNFKPKPKRVLQMELLKKGIDRQIIDGVLSVEDIDEKKIAEELLKKKAYKWKGLEPREIRQKMSTYLIGKGFGWEVINEVLDMGIE